MKRFKEVLKEEFFIYNLNGISIYSTNHAETREKEKNVDKKIVKKILQRFVFKILDDGLPRDEYLVYSKEFKQGVVCDFNGMNKIKIITVLPKYHKTVNNKKTTNVVVENLIYDDVLLKEAKDNEIIFYIVDVLLKDKELKKDRIKESVEIVEFDGIKITLCDGVLYDVDKRLVVVE